MGLKEWVHVLRNHSRLFTCHLSFILRCDFCFLFVCVCMQYFCAGFTYMRVNFYIFCVYLEQWLSREELCCSEMMQLFVIVLAMNEISLII